MSNPRSTSQTTKKERRRAAAEARAAAVRRQRQRRMLQLGLGGIGVVAVVALVVVAMLGAGGGGEGTVGPSQPGQVQTSGSPRSSMLAAGDALPSFSAPGFHMERSDGGYTVQRERIDLSSYEGGPLVVSIWAPWCPHCQVELPKLSAVMRDYPNVKLLTVVTAIDQEPGPTPDGYLSDHGLTFPVAIDDADGTLARALGIEAFPTLYFVNGDGTVVQAATGEIAESDLRSTIQSLT